MLELDFVLIAVTQTSVHHRCFKVFWSTTAEKGTLWAILKSPPLGKGVCERRGLFRQPVRRAPAKRGGGVWKRGSLPPPHPCVTPCPNPDPSPSTCSPPPPPAAALGPPLPPPPLLQKLLQALCDSPLLGSDSVVVIEYPKELRGKGLFTHVVGDKLFGLRNREYGRTTLATYVYLPQEEHDMRPEEFDPYTA